MCGDNQIVIEKGIRHDQIIGVVTSFERKGKWYSCKSRQYRIYCVLRVASIPVRRVESKIIRFAKRIIGKLKRTLKK